MKSLGEKLENALAGLLGDTITATVVPAIGSGELEYPYVVCEYSGGEEYHAQSGLTRAEVTIRAVSEVQAGTTSSGAADHNALFGQVVEILEVENLADLITQTGENLLVIGIESTTEEEPDIEDSGDIDIFTSTYTIRLLAGHP